MEQHSLSLQLSHAVVYLRTCPSNQRIVFHATAVQILVLGTQLAQITRTQLLITGSTVWIRDQADNKIGRLSEAHVSWWAKHMRWVQYCGGGALQTFLKELASRALRVI